MRTGIFGGSFDPVHIEHIALVKAAISSLKLDRVFVLPAYVPPHKRGRVLADDAHRTAMLKKAFKNVPQAIVSDYEISRGGVSYTYLPCRHFAEIYPEDTLYFLVGTDMLRDFPTWKNPEEILRYADLAVCDRAEESERWREEEQAKFFARFKKRFETVNYKATSVSSTEARVKAAAGDDTSALCGAAVAEYIRAHRLYEIPNAHEALAAEKPSRREHSLRVAVAAAKKAAGLHLPERQAVTAALFHDCAKNLPSDSPRLEGFTPPSGVPAAVVHQYAGAYVAEHAFGISDGEILDAIRYHTSGRENMSLLGKLIFLADMLESGRDFEGVEELRAAFWKDKDSLDECLYLALSHMLNYLADEGKEAYPLTRKAYEFIEKEIRNKTERRTNNV